MAPPFAEQPVYCLMRLGVRSAKVMERWPMKRKKLFTVLVYIPDVLYRPACFVRCIREAEKLCIVFII